MSRNVEELLREGIDRLAATTAAATDAGTPATLLHRARQHNRRRRQAIAGAIAAGTAAVTAAAVIAATAGPGANPDALHGQTITYVATRAEQALAQLNPSQAIEVDTLTARGGSFGFTVMNTAFNGTTGSTAQLPGVLGSVHASSEVDWSYDGLYLQHGYSAAGKLVYTVVTTGSQGYYGAAYPARIRWHNPLTGLPSSPPGGNPALTCDNAGTDFPSWKPSITKALSCHLFTLGGNQMIAGVDTIKLVGKPITAEGETFRQTLWVDPKSYLPLRTSTTFTKAHRTGTLTHDFRWLSPTKANLARLHAASERGRIPASFRSLPSTDLPLTGFDGPSK
jgi:hypothetical protein